MRERIRGWIFNVLSSNQAYPRKTKEVNGCDAFLEKIVPANAKIGQKWAVETAVDDSLLSCVSQNNGNGQSDDSDAFVFLLKRQSITD